MASDDLPEPRHHHLIWADDARRPQEPMSADQKTPNETEPAHDVAGGVDAAHAPARMVSLATDLLDDVEAFSDAIDVCEYRRERTPKGDAP